MAQPSPTDMERLWTAFRRDESGCWLWVRNIDKDGYGALNRRGRKFRAHKYLFELLVEPVPEGMVLDHLCRVRHCVNPMHLEIVTSGENTRRSPIMGQYMLARTVCRNGHPYTPESMFLRSGRWRTCRICNAIRRERWKYKQAS